ncbi:MAG: hypothetical protein MJ185_03910 [Treponema sp.]|nr:hypothetical protein [Treponema sp.]
MKKITAVLICLLFSSFIFSNGINNSPAETLVPDDAQLTFTPNAWQN